jgi:hypothetical protein
MNDIRRRPPSRATETRETEKRESSWKPPAQFPTPEAPEGIVFHWIRTSLRGEPDPRNISKRFREGWVPVPAKDYPDLQLQSDPASRFPDNIEVGGLLLCRASKDHMDGRHAYYSKVTQSQMESVDNSMFKQQDARVPMFRERSSRVSVGRKPDAKEE